MTTLWQVPALIAALFNWLSVPPVSLADAARHEAVRRALIAPSTAALTNDTLPAARPSDVPAQESEAPAASPIPAPIPVPALEAPPADPIPAVDDEKAWRTKLSTLLAALDRDRKLVDTLQGRVAGLKRDAIARDDPAQRQQLAQDLATALRDLDRTQEKVAQDQVALDTLREEARRRGVPPGWVRP